MQSRTPARRSGRDHARALDWVAWVLLRLFVLAIIAGWVRWPEQTNDLAIYRDWVDSSLAHGTFPTDQLWQYPPLAGLVFLIGAALPGDALGFATLFLAFDAAVMVMLDQQALRTTLSGGRRLWAVLALVVGPLLLARFDVVPTAFAVAAVLLAARPGTSGVLAAVGAWIKVWPALVISALRRRDLPRGVGGALAASAVIAASLLTTTTDSMSFLTGQRERGLQIESVAAWPFLLARALGMPVEVVYRYGAHEIEAAGVGAVAAACALGSALMLATVAVARLSGRLEHVAGSDVALATVLFTVVTSRVFSGQYFIWLLGLAAVCLGDPRSRMRRTTALLVGAALATHLIYPWMFTWLLEGNSLAVAVQGVRIGLTVWATVLAAWLVLGPRRTDQPGGLAASGRPATSVGPAGSAGPAPAPGPEPGAPGTTSGS